VRRGRCLHKAVAVFLVCLLIGFVIASFPTVTYALSPPSPPTITSPGSASEPGPVLSTLTPTLQWNAVSGADYYALAISKYPYGSGYIVYNPQQLTGTSHVVPSGTLVYGEKYRWNMQAHNSAGWSAVSNTLYFQTPPPTTPDTTKPTITSLSVNPSTTTLGNSFTISFSVSDSGGSGLKQVELWRANDSSGSPGTWAQVTTRAVSGNSYSGSFSDTPSSAGSYWYGIHAVDNANNWNAEPTPVKVTVTTPDTTKPTITSLSVNPSTTTLGNSFTISFSVSDSGGSGLKQVELWRANDSSGSPGTWAQVTTRAVSGNSYSGSFSDTPSSAGSYWYGIHAVDNANNWNAEPTPVKVTVTTPDTTKPTITSLSVNPSTTTLGNSFTISFSVSDSGGSGLKQVELWRANDSSGSPGTWAQVTTRAVSGNSYSGSFSDTPSSAGSYWYGIHAVDNANNWNAEPTPVKVTVTTPDTTKPTITSLSVNPSTTTLGNSFTISFSVSDSGGSGLKQVELWRANDSSGSPGTWAQVTTRAVSGNSYSGSFSDTPSSAGSYWYGIHAVDNANNWNAEPTPVKVTVTTPDTTKPTITSLSVNPSTTTLGNSFTISFSVSDSGGSGLKQVELWRANDSSGSPGTWAQVTTRAVSGNSYSGSFSDTPSSAGSYWYGIHAVDNANNWNAEPTPVKVTVTTPDTTKPTITSLSVNPSTTTLGNSFTISFSVSDSGGSGLKQVELWRANDSSGSPGTWAQVTTRAVSGNSYSGSFSDTPSSAGSYWYGIHAVDNANNWNAEPTPVKVTVTTPDTTKPTITSLSVNPSTTTLGNSFTISFSVSDSGGSGLKQVELWRANDSSGSPGTWAQVTTRAVSGNSYSGSFSDTPSSAGSYWYGIHAVDNANNWNAEPTPVKVTVTTPDTTKPTITSLSVNPSTTTLGNSFTISFSVSDSGGSGLKQVELWRANDSSGSPGTWAQVTTRAVSGNSYSGSFSDTPSSAGSYWYGIHAVDNANNWNAEPTPVKVTVTTPDTTKPTITSLSVNPSTTTLGNSFTISFSVSDSGGSGLKQVELWRANDSSGSPGTWAQVTTRAVSGNSYSGSFSDTPSSAGSYWYGIHAVDNANNWNAEPTPVKVTVTTPDTTKPTITSLSVNPSTTTLGNSFTISFSVSDSGGSGLKQVELWRANDSSGSPGTWAQVTTRAVSGNSYSGSFSDTPSSAGSYWYGIHAVDNANNWNAEPTPVKVTVTTPEGPYIGNIEPSSGAPGIEVTIKGINFGDMDPRNKGVLFEWERWVGLDTQVEEAEVMTWNDTEIVVKVPPGKGKEDTVNVYVVYGGGFKRSKNSVEFTYVKPSINPIEPTEPKAGPPGERVAIKGENFGFVDPKDLNPAYYSHIKFGNSQVGSGDIDSWTDNEIVIRKTPSDYGTGIGDATIIKDLVELATLGIIKGTISIADVGKLAVSKLIPNLATLELKDNEEWWKSYAKIMAALGVPGVEVRPEADKGGLIWVPVTVETSAGKDETGLFAYVIPLSIVSTTPPCIIGTSLPSQPTGSDYMVTFDAVGGIPPYKWSVSGELPPGLHLDPSTGVLSGTLPPTPKTYEFTITVQDNSQAKGARVQTDSRQFSLKVTPPEAWRVIPDSANKLPDRDSPWSVTIIGTGFTSPVKLDFGDGVTVHSALVIDSNHIKAYISISKDAPTGKRDVLITFPRPGLSVKIPKGFDVVPPTYLESVTANPEYLAWIHSPAELRVYDSQNRVTGLVDGEVREEIPNSSYHNEGRIVIISNATDSYRYEVVGTGEGTYGLEIASVKNGNVTTFAATDIPISAKAIHEYTVDWDALRRSEPSIGVQIDFDGDKTFEQTKILQPPTASFILSPVSALADQEIRFDASASGDVDGEIASYKWGFGDGNTASGQIVAHTYSTAGNYTVTLTVIDDDGVLATYSRSVQVGERQQGVSIWVWIAVGLVVAVAMAFWIWRERARK
jgi:hypothetical protein